MRAALMLAFEHPAFFRIQILACFVGVRGGAIARAEMSKNVSGGV
jgi:hypothetical protein